MGSYEIREPTQKRSIETKEKIIKAGFDLICQKGYYSTNTAEIAKEANVSTGIIYQYFKDKHDILIAGISKYASVIFYPMLSVIPSSPVNKENLKEILKKMIQKFIQQHKLSETAHEEIMAMTHIDKDVAQFFHEHELFMANNITKILLENGFDSVDLNERVHISINLIDDLCHEIVYHKHDTLNYEQMSNLVIDTVYNLLV